jgi:acetoin utilization protein AcuB
MDENAKRFIFLRTEPVGKLKDTKTTLGSVTARKIDVLNKRREGSVKVSEIMTRKLITVSPDDSVEKTVQLFRERRVRHLLVLKGERLVGIISDRDLVHALEPVRGREKKVLNVGGLYFLLEPMEVREIMSRDVITIGPERSVQDAAAMMLSSRFGALPVVADGELMGIVTETDLLRCLTKLGPESRPKKKARPAARAKRRR